MPITASWEQEKTVATEDELRELLRVQMPFHFAGDAPPGFGDETLGTPDVLRHFANIGYGDFDYVPDLHRVSKPTLVIVGEHDRTTTPRAAKALHEGIAGSRLVVLPGVGHMSFVETPEPYIDAVTTFLQRGRRLMWRLRLFFERVGWKPFAIGAGIVVLVAVAAGAAIALLGGGDESSAPTTTAVQERTNVYYLRAVAPENAGPGLLDADPLRLEAGLPRDPVPRCDRDHHRDRNGHRRLVQTEVHAQGPGPRRRPGRPRGAATRSGRRR